MTTSPQLSLTQVKFLLQQFNIEPKKSLGQNFLIAENWLRRICEAADIAPTDWVLEIGPGLGSLTRWLATVSQQVIAVELDRRLFDPLALSLTSFTNVSLVHGDILLQDLPELLEGKLSYKVVANVPYYVTAAIIRKLLETPQPPTVIVLTIQHEVAKRICAKPGDMSLLAVSVQFYGEPRYIAQIPAGAFWPAPTVDSAILRIDVHPQPLFGELPVAAFFNVVRAGFGQKRKQLQVALSHGLHLSRTVVVDALTAVKIDPRRRAETLALPEWAALTQALLPQFPKYSADPIDWI